MGASGQHQSSSSSCTPRLLPRAALGCPREVGMATAPTVKNGVQGLGALRGESQPGCHTPRSTPSTSTQPGQGRGTQGWPRIVQHIHSARHDRTARTHVHRSIPHPHACSADMARDPAAAHQPRLNGGSHDGFWIQTVVSARQGFYFFIFL